MFQWLKYCLSTFLLLFLLPPGSNITIYRIDWEFYTSIEEKNYKAFNWQKLKSIQLIKVDIVTAGTKVGKFVNVISAPRACNAPCSACPALIFQIPVIFKIFQTPVIFLVWWAEKQYQRPKTKVSCFNLSNTSDFQKNSNTSDFFGLMRTIVEASNILRTRSFPGILRTF